METDTYDFPEPGLYFDGCRGAEEIDRLIIELAEQYGWDGDNSDEAPPDEADEFLSEVADEAIDFLNNLETREGHYWAYGENAEGFGLWTERGE